MPRNRLTSPQQKTFVEGRERLLQQIHTGELSIGQSIKAMRELLGMTQTEYGEKVAKVSRKAISLIENDQGDPRLSTLNRCCRAFGVEVGLVCRNAER